MGRKNDKHLNNTGRDRKKLSKEKKKEYNVYTSKHVRDVEARPVNKSNANDKKNSKKENF